MIGTGRVHTQDAPLALLAHAEHLAALRGGCEAVAGLDAGDTDMDRLGLMTVRVV